MGAACFPVGGTADLPGRVRRRRRERRERRGVYGRMESVLWTDQLFDFSRGTVSDWKKVRVQNVHGSQKQGCGGSGARRLRAVSLPF